MNGQWKRVLAVACALVAPVAVFAVSGGEGKGDGTTHPVVNDYEDWEQRPIRNAELLKLVDEAELIVAVQFDLPKLLSAVPPTNAWVAAVVEPHVFREGLSLGRLKSGCGKQIMIQGDPKAFANEAWQHINRGSFVENNTFLLFLKAVGSSGMYRCVDSNPGGFRVHAGRGDSDHRKMFAGTVNGALVVEGAGGYHGARMNGPTNMRDLLEGTQSGLKLTATATGGATVELTIQNSGSGPVKIPKDIRLFAPLLWAEIEGAASDRALLAACDYTVSKYTDPHAELQTLAPSNAVKVTVELPTGPVPKDATRRWALNNHVKPLAGSLPAGKSDVRLLFRPNKETIVMSNVVKVEGKPGGATPEQVAAVPGFPLFQPAPAAAKDLPPLKDVLDRGEVKGEIWFDSNRDGNWEIYRMDPNGSNVVNVTRTPDADEIEVRVAPDGKRILYKSGKKGMGRAGFWGRTSNAGWTFTVADRNGEKAVALADAVSINGWWDSRTVMYGSKTNGLCLSNLDTGEVRTGLLKDVAPWLSGAEGSLATGTRQLLGGGGPHTALNAVPQVIDLDEQGGFKGFTPVASCYRGCTHRWLSPGGRRIMYAHHDPKHRGGIILWTVKPDGSDPARFPVTEAGWAGYGAYCESPDGTMAVGEAGGGTLCIIRYADGASVPVVQKQGESGAPEWHSGASAPVERSAAGRSN